jgi:hypothetical protein
MLKISHAALVAISGLVWFAVGGWLLPLGLSLMLEGTKQAQLSDVASLPLLRFLSPYLGGFEQAALLLIVVGLLIGQLKGLKVLGKSAQRGIERIKTFPNPTEITNIYSAKYYILLGGMVGLGMGIKFLGLSNDVRGLVDIAIGTALIRGALIYFRSAFQLRQEKKLVTEKK